VTAEAEEQQRAIRYRDASPRRRRRLWLIVPFAVLVVLVVLVVVIGIAGRAWAEQYLEERVEQNLPEGVEGDVDVRLRGVFLLGQYLSGRMDDVRLTSENLTVQGIPVEARVRLQGAPIDLAQPVEHLTGSVRLDEAAVQAMLTAQGYPGTATIEDGGIRYTDSAELFGATVEYDITARPDLEGGRLDLVPTSAAIRSGDLDLDATGLLERVAPEGLSVCLAEYLPDSIVLESLRVGADAADVSFSGDGVVLTEEALARRGACT
jgi:LmeA-like phospholipid-binding